MRSFSVRCAAQSALFGSLAFGFLACGFFACGSDDSSPETNTQTITPFGGPSGTPATTMNPAQENPAAQETPTGNSTDQTPATENMPSNTPQVEGQPNPTLNQPPPANTGGAMNPQMNPPPPAMDPQDPPVQNPPVQNPPPAAGTPVRCDNLALAPSTNGVAQPSGAVGGLKVLDWAGFKGAASFTFDDNTPSQMDNYAQLKATGGRFTWFVVGNFLGSNAAEIARFKATQADGMEVANHTFSHQSAGSLADLMQNQNYINTNFGVNANSMAAPNCAAAWATVAPNLLFQNRGPCGAPINTIRAGAADNTSPFAIPAYLPAANEAAGTMSAALVDGQWRVYVIHGFDNRNGTFQPIPIANVTGAISTAVTRGFWVEGMSNIGAYWQGQKLISAAATTSATWTKPARFPANMCLRITTTGGTVTQKGQVIPWDAHGYYQIGLDAGEVTIQ